MCNICYVENLRRAEDRKTKLIVLASPPSPSRPVAICLPCLPRLFWDRNIISTLGLWLQRKSSDNNWITPSEMCYQCLNLILLRVKNSPTLGVNLCRALSPRVSVGTSHHPSASHSSDIWRHIILSWFSASPLTGQICSHLAPDWWVLPLHSTSDVIPPCTFFASLMLSTLWWYPGEKWPRVAVTKYRRVTRNIQRPDMTRAGVSWPVVGDHEQCV